MPALLALLAALPEILSAAPAVGVGIYNLLHLHAGELPEEVRAKLADVKLRQAVQDAEWDAGLSPAVQPAAAQSLAVLTAENARLQDALSRANEQVAAMQAGGDAADGSGA